MLAHLNRSGHRLQLDVDVFGGADRPRAAILLHEYREINLSKEFGSFLWPDDIHDSLLSLLSLASARAATRIWRHNWRVGFYASLTR